MPPTHAHSPHPAACSPGQPASDAMYTALLREIELTSKLKCDRCALRVGACLAPGHTRGGQSTLTPPGSGWCKCMARAPRTLSMSA